MTSNHDDLERKVDRLIEVIDGPIAIELDGTLVRMKDEGLKSRVEGIEESLDRIEQRLANGIELRLRLIDKISGIVLAVITIVLSVVFGGGT